MILARRLCGRIQATAAVVAVGLPLLGATQAAEPSSQTAALKPPALPKPNIIFILADDLGYGDLGCYGQKMIKTPNLDRLAAEGMRFTQCYAGSTVSAPSRACLMTGFHTGHVTIRGNRTVPLRREDVTVAEILKKAGYRTAALGKWGLGLEGSSGTPNRKGFDEWFGYLDQVHAHNYYPTNLWRNDQRLSLKQNENNRKAEYSHHWFTRAATNFMRLNQDRPFFLYLAYTIPHANNELGRQTGNGMEVPSAEPYEQEPWPQPEKNKAAMISLLDRDVGRLSDELKRLKIDSNTVVFFSSDNGPSKEGGVDPSFFESSGPLHGLKRDLYEGGIRVPLIVRWPGKMEAGFVSDQWFTFWDFLPTAAKIANFLPPPCIDGLSLLPTLLKQRQTNQHEYLYWESHEGGFSQAVRRNNWKALRRGIGQKPELYDLMTDPYEERDVANSHPNIVERMLAYMKHARTESQHWPVESAQRRRVTAGDAGVPPPTK